jgi:hypothetical protein
MRLLDRRHYIVLLLGLLAGLPAWAVAPAPAATAPTSAYLVDTGDAWVDRQLADIGNYARRYPDSFIDELVRYAGVRRGYVQALLQQHGWHAGDIYFACFWTHAMNLSCRDAVRAWSRDNSGGWKTVVTRLPITPDNLHYRALRHAIVSSYDHWERPIVLDATLRRQLGDYAQRRRTAIEAMQAASPPL